MLLPWRTRSFHFIGICAATVAAVATVATVDAVAAVAAVAALSAVVAAVAAVAASAQKQCVPSGVRTRELRIRNESSLPFPFRFFVVCGKWVPAEQQEAIESNFTQHFANVE